MIKKSVNYGDKAEPPLFCYQCGGKCNVPYIVTDGHRLCRRDCYDKYLVIKKSLDDDYPDNSRDDMPFNYDDGC